jgi:AhpD family alkylhydroperoxidase
MILRNISVLLVPSVFGASAALCQYWSQPAPIRLHPVAVATLEKQERAQAKATARVDLSSSGAGLVDPADSLEPTGSENVPNYVKAFASRPGAPGAFAHVVKTFLYGGLVQPEVKLGMALRVAQLNSNPYVAAHVERLLRSTDDGKTILSAIAADKAASLPIEQRLALKYADELSPEFGGVGEGTFREVRGYYNDSQIVELTLTVCFFNYFTRLAEGLNLPVEAWVLDIPAHPDVPAFHPYAGRVPFLTDAHLALLNWDQDAPMKEMAERTKSGMGMYLPNSERTMLWAPNFPQAWWAFGSIASKTPSTLPRAIRSYVTFAVATSNGCRYCTLHTLLGLRHAGVDPGKLLAMKKDDSQLSPQELTAVLFARKLTRRTGTITDDDWSKLTTAFGETGAQDILLAACGMNYLNRFNDAMHSPSEDNAIQTYREVYGADWTPTPVSALAH